MSLVHDRIVAQMRARGDAPVLPSLARISGEALSVFSAKPLAASVAGTVAPSDVTLGLPSARDTVRIYAGRLDIQIEKINTAWHTWLKFILDEHRALTEDQVKFDAEWPAFYSRWKIFLGSIQSFSILGPSPVEAWNQTYAFDDEAEAFRVRLATFSGASVPPGAPDLGKQPSPVADTVKDIGSAVATGVKWIFIGGLALGSYALYEHYKTSRRPATG